MNNTEHQDPDQKTISFPKKILYFLLPLFLLGGLLTYLFTSGRGLPKSDNPPVLRINIPRVTLPEEGIIRLSAVNDGPDPVTISQVMVDEAYWKFSASPSRTIKPRQKTTITIPYHWVHGNKHEITLVTQEGATFHKEIPVAVKTPSLSVKRMMRFGMVGVYVGVLPVLLGILWFPLISSLSRRALHFVLALTAGLLAYLAVVTWLDAVEFTEHMASFWQGVPMIVMIAAGTAIILMAISRLSSPESGTGDAEPSPLWIAYMIALGIGLHNLGEGLAVGASFSAGEASLGAFLIVGFTLHNVTEGVGIAAPVADERPALYHFLLLVLLAGGPAVPGMWIGGFAFHPVLATAFFAAGVGAILQVIWEVGKLIHRDTRRENTSLLHWTIVSGFLIGALIMYITGFLVKI